METNLTRHMEGLLLEAKIKETFGQAPKGQVIIQTASSRQVLTCGAIEEMRGTLDKLRSEAEELVRWLDALKAEGP